MPARVGGLLVLLPSLDNQNTGYLLSELSNTASMRTSEVWQC